jgi:O-Antigen ligase
MSEEKVGGDVIAVLGLVGLLVCIGTLVDDATVGLLLSPIVFLLLVFAMTRVPLRLSAMGLMFLAFTLPDPMDHSAAPDFEAPFHGLGAILLSHLNTLGRSLGFSWASFSGIDLLIVALGFIALARRGSKAERLGHVPLPKPLLKFAYLSLASTAWVLFYGTIRGGDLSKAVWQVNRVMYLPILFLIFQASLRGPKDLGALLKVVLCSAVYKSLLALYIVATNVLPPDMETGSTKPAWATSHQDSILFAVAFVCVIAVLLERAVPRKQIKWYALLLVVLAAGTWANNRRMAWVQVVLVFVTVYLMADPKNPRKRKLNRAALLVSPLALAYLVVGWRDQGLGRLYKPVRMLRSVVDPSSDSSTNWRELENFDIMMTFRQNPVFGTGYGHPYLEIIQLPPVNYDLELYCPHNSLLALWAYCGLVGFATLTLLWASGVYFAMRTYKGASDPKLRAAALVCFGTVLAYLIQCWGDLGLGTWIGVFTVAPALVMAGKLAAASGQWGPQNADVRGSVSATT